MNKNFGFTLAEVLLTLGIIGVIAALTIPQLVSNYQKKVVPTRLKKMYNTLWNAIYMAEEENGPTDNWTFNDDDEAREFYKTQIKSRMKCVDRKVNRSYYFEGMNCSLPDGSYIVLNNMRSYGLLEVIFYPFSDKKSLSYNYATPGNKHRRNYFRCNVWLAPRKVAGSELPAKTEVTVMNQDATKVHREKLLNGPGPVNSPYEYCGNGGTGAASCFQLIKRDGWEIKDDYPW
jgi:prepilin-type cleavage/methylation N-terminal domain protein